MELSELEGKVVTVVIPVNGNPFSMNLKVCRVKVRSVLFIEVNKSERKNIFRKAPMKMLNFFNGSSITFKEGTTLTKWESSWDTIGSPTFGYTPRPFYSNHSKGWSSNAPQYRRTTNSSAGFPMV